MRPSFVWLLRVLHLPTSSKDQNIRAKLKKNFRFSIPLRAGLGFLTIGTGIALLHVDTTMPSPGSDVTALERAPTNCSAATSHWHPLEKSTGIRCRLLRRTKCICHYCLTIWLRRTVDEAFRRQLRGARPFRLGARTRSADLASQAG